MKKIYSLFVLLFCIAQLADAQYYQIPWPNAQTNPGSLNIDPEYPVGGGLAAGWATVLGPSASPAWSANQTVPFSFQFNGAAATSYKVSNSGILTFDVASALAAPSFTKAALPNSAIPNNAVCIWGMSGIGANDNVISKTFGTAPNRQHWIQFSSYGYGGATSDGSNFTYWSIVLDETSNRIHIVDNRTGGYAASAKVVSAGIQINASTAFSVATSPNLLALADVDPTPADNSYYTFIPGTAPNYDLMANSITTSPFLVAGNNTIAGTIRNLGGMTITSMDMNYKIDGGTAVTSTLSGLSIAPLATYTFSHPTSWNATIGTHTIDVYATNLNGSNPDANPSDDHKLKTVSVLSENVQRTPLFEIFTSSTCGPCKPGNETFHAVVDLKPQNDFVTIKYQQDFPGTGDPYCTTEAVNRRTTPYAINSIPRMEIDGGWDNNAGSFTTALYDASRAIPAQFKMAGTYDINNMTISAKVKFSPLFNSTGAKLYVAILENKTINNVKSNGETQFTSVMKKMLPTETGSNLPTVAIGAWDSLSFSYTFKGNYRLPVDGQAANRINHTTEHSVEAFYNTKVVAWIQAADKSVFQAINLTSLVPAGTDNFSATFDQADVFPNPTSDLLNVQLNLKQSDEIFATIVDINGNVVSTLSKKCSSGKNSFQFNTSNLSTGIYHVMLFDSKNNSSVHKIEVRH